MKNEIFQIDGIQPLGTKEKEDIRGGALLAFFIAYILLEGIANPSSAGRSFMAGFNDTYNY